MYPVAGAAFEGDLSGFERLGIEVDWSGNVKFMQVPIAGSDEFLREWADEKWKELAKVFEGLKGLSSKHAALYLLKGEGARVN